MSCIYEYGPAVCFGISSKSESLTIVFWESRTIIQIPTSVDHMYQFFLGTTTMGLRKAVNLSWTTCMCCNRAFFVHNEIWFEHYCKTFIRIYKLTFVINFLPGYFVIFIRTVNHLTVALMKYHFCNFLNEYNLVPIFIISFNIANNYICLELIWSATDKYRLFYIIQI